MRRPALRRAAPLLSLLLLVAAPAPSRAASQAAPPAPSAPPHCTPALVRAAAFGAGSGAHQFEGHPAGRAPSVWEPYIASNPKAIADGSNASIGAGFYDKYLTDIQIMRRLGLKHFRLSISWPRLIPGAKKGSAVSGEAARFYSSLLDALLAAGVQPMVALYHWDLPQALQDEYGGFVSPRIVDDFTYYADKAFRLFGPKVKTWLTFIEPAVICNQQYGNGQFAPGKDLGDAGRYACGHNVLLAHASAASLYRGRYRAAQDGRLSFSTLVTWAEPASGSRQDQIAAQNKLDSEVGWFLDPVFLGDYPASLRASKGALLPRFSPEQAAAVRGSLDFVAANCFSAKWVSAPQGTTAPASGAASTIFGAPKDAPPPFLGWRESKVNPYNKTSVGPPSGVPWIDVAPWSQGRMLRYIQRRYGDPQILITSSGVMGPGEAKAPAAQQLQDGFRLDYYRSYLDDVCRAVQEARVRLIGWFAWSLLDAWEWRDGYTVKFGVVRVNYSNASLPRTPKASARWLSRHVFNGSAAAVPHA